MDQRELKDEQLVAMATAVWVLQLDQREDDAVLVFSFHHSRLDGWLAIYNAIEKAGLSINTIYPVKAEMSTASPKSSAKEPINIDAIFVCKKATTTVTDASVDDSVFWAYAQHAYSELCRRLISVGRELSEGDRRVIMIAAFLKECSMASLSYQQVAEKLKGKELKDLSEFIPDMQASSLLVEEVV